MEILKTTVIAMLGLGATIMVGLLKDEAAAWLPRMIEGVLRVAVARAPKQRREQYREEWSSHVAEYPGKLSQLWQACFCLWAAGYRKPWNFLRVMAYLGTVSLLFNGVICGAGTYMVIYHPDIITIDPALYIPLLIGVSSFTGWSYWLDISRYIRSTR